MGYVVGIDEGSSNMIVKSSVTGNHDPCPSTTLVIYTTFTKHYVTLLASSLTNKYKDKEVFRFELNATFLVAIALDNLGTLPAIFQKNQKKPISSHKSLTGLKRFPPISPSALSHIFVTIRTSRVTAHG